MRYNTQVMIRSLCAFAILLAAAPLFAGDKINPARFIESLANKNTPPKVQQLHNIPQPRFDEKYDWREYKRIWDKLREMAEHSEELWPELVKHMEDERYCISVQSPESDYLFTFTIGDVCHQVALSSLNESYLRAMTPMNRSVLAQYHRPSFASDAKSFRKWCEERKDKKLYELQIEASQWAVEKLKHDEAIRHVSTLRRKAWIATIEADIEDLQKTNRTANCRWFQGESFGAYNAEKAARIRKQLDLK